MFNVGDRVICIYKDMFDFGIVIGKEYTIKSKRENVINSDITVYTLNEIRGAFDSYCFKSIKTIRKEKIDKINYATIDELVMLPSFQDGNCGFKSHW